MRRQSPLPIAFIAALFALLAGCHPQQPFYFHEDPDLSHWQGVAQEIEQADLDYCSLPDVEGAVRPYSLQNNEPKEIWDLTLEEAVRCALTNNKIMRNIGGQVQGAPESILRNPEAVPSIYDPALAETDPRGGVEAALSAFDTQFSLSTFWEKNDQPRNTNPITETFMPSLLQQDLGTFQAQLQKTAATGGTFYLRHNVQYDRENGVLANGDKLNTRTFIGDWNVNLEAEFRQPLLQGAGAQFNRIAGPGATPGMYNGVMLARINTDIALTQFEANVRNLVSDVEIAYWELYYYYRSLDAVIRGRDSALKRWQVVYSYYLVGRTGGDAAVEAQARQQYFLFRSTVEQALTALYQAEAKLRYLMGLAATDGRLIRPIEEPTSARVVFDWYEIHAEALARNVELRQLQWLVKRRELELIAAKNFLLPRLDLVGRYRWLGMGSELINYDPTTNPPTDNNVGMNPSAYRSMTLGDYQEWQMGIQFQMPIGFRRELSGVRNAQLQLSKEKAILQEGELELSHQLAQALREMEDTQVISKTNFNSMIAAQRNLRALQILWDSQRGDRATLISVLLEAQRTLAQTESEYYRSVVNYNEAIMRVHYRKGSLLEYNGICLAEGPWPGKAYFDAERRARSRDAAMYLDYGYTLPKVVSRGPIRQHVGNPDVFGRAGNPKTEKDADRPELIPTPEPALSQPGGAAMSVPEEPSFSESSSDYEPDAYSPAAEPALSASGRQGIQR
ncbi:MAG: TolC family protein [Pirellulales bacterium]|nr:TolC family protein [Pirellulales bacterium]